MTMYGVVSVGAGTAVLLVDMYQRISTNPGNLAES